MWSVEREVPADHMCGSARVLKGKEELDRTTQLRVPPRWEGQRQSRRSTEIDLSLPLTPLNRTEGLVSRRSPGLPR